MCLVLAFFLGAIANAALSEPDGSVDSPETGKRHEAL